MCTTLYPCSRDGGNNGGNDPGFPPVRISPAHGTGGNKKVVTSSIPTCANTWLTWFMTDMMRSEPVDYDVIGDQVRRFCAEKLYDLEKGLRPLVDGTFGEVLPGHLAGYLATIRQLGKLYQVEKPPRDLANLIPAVKVQEILARMREQHELEVAAAVAEAENKVRAELMLGSERNVAQARELVSSKLMELEARIKS